MKNKREPFDFLKDLEEQSVLIGKDKSGTEYYAPKDLSQIDFNLLEARHKVWTIQLLSNNWKHFKFELGSLLCSIWWYVEMKLGR